MDLIYNLGCKIGNYIKRLDPDGDIDTNDSIDSIKIENNVFDDNIIQADLKDYLAFYDAMIKIGEKEEPSMYRDLMINECSKVWFAPTSILTRKSIPPRYIFITCLYALAKYYKQRVPIREQSEFSSFKHELITEAFETLSNRQQPMKTINTLKRTETSQNTWRMEHYPITITKDNNNTFVFEHELFNGHVMNKIPLRWLDCFEKNTIDVTYLNAYQMLALYLPFTKYYTEALDIFFSSYCKARSARTEMDCYEDWFIINKNGHGKARLPLRAMAILLPPDVLVQMMPTYMSNSVITKTIENAQRIQGGIEALGKIVGGNEYKISTTDKGEILFLDGDNKNCNEKVQQSILSQMLAMFGLDGK